MYDPKLISTRYRAVAFMSGHSEAYEAMQEYPTLEGVPMSYLPNVQDYFRKEGIPVRYRYYDSSKNKTTKPKAESFSVEPRKTNKRTVRFFTI